MGSSSLPTKMRGAVFYSYAETSSVMTFIAPMRDKYTNSHSENGGSQQIPAARLRELLENAGISSVMR